MPNRLCHRAGLTLIAAGAAATLAAWPAGAAGESTTATLTSPSSGTSTEFTWSYTFSQSGGHGLSNIAITFCSDELLDHVASASPDGEIFTTGDVPGGHTGFGPGIKFPLTATEGTFTVVFDEPYGIATQGLWVQSHSGDGEEGDATTTAAGPDACPTQTEEPTTTTTEAPTTTTTEAPTTTTTEAPTTTTTAGALVLGAVQEQTPSAVLPAGAELPRTGTQGTLLSLGVALLAAGLACLVLGRRRTPSSVTR